MVIKVEGLRLEYRTGAGMFPVLDIPSWKVGDQAQTAITGSSGSGKSTLLNILAGLLKPSAGSVEVCGTELTRLSESQRDKFRGKNLSYIFQTFNLLQGYTALENVMLGAAFTGNPLDRRSALALLARVGLSRRSGHYPSQLSIGEQQRVAISRSLAKKPKLILADEPTGSLDPFHSGEVVDLLCEACREHGCALILVSHEMKVAERFADRVDFMTLNLALSGMGGKK